MGSATFNSTGGWAHWAVPDKVKLVHVVLHGAGSGSGRRGGKVEGDLAVKDSDVLWLLVGAAGHANSGGSGGAGGFGGGARGGDGNGHPGGDGGGGYAAIRLNGSAGAIKAVAGGGAGDSGDGGDGGNGGDATGESGHRGSAGTGSTGAATGGTQSQGGNGGTSSAGAVYAGNEASDTALGSAGRGSGPGAHNGPGGGGGGGGYRAGGGGQAGAQGSTPGGGGGGGSNFDAPLTSSSSIRGSGNVGAGSITVSWSDPTSDPRPNPPASLVPADGKRLKANKVTVKATLTDSVGTEVRMKIALSVGNKFANSKIFYSDYVKTGKTATKDIDLKPNNHYYIRVWAQDKSGQLSLHYSTSNFYSNYDPTAPTLLTPANGHQDDNLGSIVFDWTPHDPDGQAQGGAQLQYIRERDRTVIALRHINGSQSSYTEDPLFFKANNFYLWQVRTKDPLGQWGPWSSTFRLYITGLNTPPLLRSPINREAADTSAPVRLRWRFRDPNQNDTQAKADVRYRVDGTSLWTTRLGTTGTPGSSVHWDFPPGTFAAGFRYEWQARTYDAHSGGITPSGWSDSELFHAISTASVDDVFADADASLGSLGCGINEAYLAVKGGHHLLGRLGPASAIQWSRIRDDISTALITIPVDAPDCDQVRQLLKVARSWQHEVIIFRTANGTRHRVFEGPITRLAYKQGAVEVEAKDVMGWVYRRIMRQGYNDSHPNTQTVVRRAGQIIMNALAPDDPNVLQYLTMLTYPDDAREARVRKDWSTTAWAEVDDMAQNAGLDYATIGRRIILFDTSRPIGRLPVMRSIDFDQAPVITEYGMLFCTTYGVSNGTGIYGSAHRDESFTGPVELLVAAYGQHAAAPGAGSLTAEAKRHLQETFKDQARRGIASRYPLPVVVRVPDNASLRPEVPVSIQHLVPGVWIPVQADHVCRSHTGWQKLDQVTVVQDAAQGEKVQVVMSPAPSSGEDPDKAAAEEADSGN